MIPKVRVDADGRIIDALGDVGETVYPTVEESIDGLSFFGGGTSVAVLYLLNDYLTKKHEEKMNQ